MSGQLGPVGGQVRWIGPAPAMATAQNSFLIRSAA